MKYQYITVCKECTCFCILLYPLGNIFQVVRMTFTVYQRISIFNMLKESSNFLSRTIEALVAELRLL